MNASSSTVKQSIGFALILGVFLYLTLLISNDWHKVQEISWQQNWHLLLMALGFCLVVQLLLCFIWHRLIQTYHALNYKKSDLLRSYFLPIIGKYLPGKVLFVLGRIEFLNKLGVSRHEASLLFLMETFLLIAAAAILSIPYMSYIPDAFGFQSDKFEHIGSLAVTAIFITVAAIASYFILIKVVKTLSNKFKIIEKILGKINDIQQSICQRPDHFISFLLSYIGLWLCYAIAGVLICISIDPTIFSHTASSHETIITAFLLGSAFIASWLIGFLAIFSPGGLGVREISLILFLSPLMSSLDASLAALIARLLWTISEFSFVAIAVIWPKKTNP